MTLLRSLQAGLAGLFLWGCTVAPHVPDLGFSDVKPIDVCIHGKIDDSLNRAFADRVSAYGLESRFRPLDPEWWELSGQMIAGYEPVHEHDRGEYQRTVALIFLPTDCHVIIVYDRPVGAALGCAFGMPCAFTRGRNVRLDAVIWVYVGAPAVMRHEAMHIFGDDCGDFVSSARCEAAIRRLREKL